MTSTTDEADTAQHPDVSEISDLTEGILPQSRTADVRRHLESCELCADVHTSLEEIRGLLGTLPGPQRMPADIAGRIDAALAAEALLDATMPESVESAAHVSRETTPIRTMEPTAVTRPSGRPRAAVGPGRDAQRRRRRHTAVFGAAFGAAVVLGVGVFALQSNSQSDNATGGRAAEGAKMAGDRLFSNVAIESKVQTLLGQKPKLQESAPGTKSGKPSSMGTANSESPTAGVQEEGGTAFHTTDVPACVLQGTGRTTDPLAAEHGRFEGSDAYLLVLPDPSDAERVQAYVVAASCVNASPPAKGELLLSQVYPRR
ncbi:hypothetical protein [Streptomyces sp. NPDC050504]|uniref:hypothetical protein n=1 Tax=Streptomyces sp. NPDC050504 TaxID=3365618 RepID=UPI003791DDDC